MSLLERLLDALLNTKPLKRVYRFEGELVDSLQRLAARERRSEQELAQDLLADALAQRQAAEDFVRVWRELTAREQQVVALTCLGFTNKEIAARLSLSAETIKSHMRTALRKFNIPTKVALRRALKDWDFSEWKSMRF
jgi:DNA-binding NarL/FixJ family response regulator